MEAAKVSWDGTQLEVASGKKNLQSSLPNKKC
jgi:hypothetical protein